MSWKTLNNTSQDIANALQEASERIQSAAFQKPSIRTNINNIHRTNRSGAVRLAVQTKKPQEITSELYATWLGVCSEYGAKCIVSEGSHTLEYYVDVFKGPGRIESSSGMLYTLLYSGGMLLCAVGFVGTVLYQMDPVKYSLYQ